jgi:hypothetical protein
VHGLREQVFVSVIPFAFPFEHGMETLSFREHLVCDDFPFEHVMEIHSFSEHIVYDECL